MVDTIFLSTAYLPPIEYFYRIFNAKQVVIEREENYVKQTYRNRCNILTTNGLLSLTVPVMQGSSHKTPIKEIKIDYSKRWQQVHLRALTSAYGSSPFFMFYFDDIRDIIDSSPKYLLDLNERLLYLIANMLKMPHDIVYSEVFASIEGEEYDFRYSISPKVVSTYQHKDYTRVFESSKKTSGLSIVDLLFNTGPEATLYL